LNRVLLGLVLVLPILFVINSQDAYALPDCVSGSKATLFGDEMYIVTPFINQPDPTPNTPPNLNKLDLDDATHCVIGTTNLAGSATLITCTDIALRPVVGPDELLCITFGSSPGKLFELDRSNGDASLKGSLFRDGDSTKEVTDLNALECDSAGLCYAWAINGALYLIDPTNGDLGLLAVLPIGSSGDLAWDPVSANMYGTSPSCPILQDADCGAGVSNEKDGLWRINLVDYSVTFIKSLEKRDVFALDFTAVGMLCGVTGEFGSNPDKGIFLSTDTTPLGAITFISTGNCDPTLGPITCLIATGGTFLNLLLGGQLVDIDKLAWLLGGIQTSLVWIMPIVLVGVGFTVFKYRNNAEIREVKS